MNIELILPVFVVCSVAIGWGIAYLLGKSLLYGAIFGFIVGMLPLLILGFMVTLFSKWRPERPECVCGKCKSEDYQSIDSKMNIKEGIYFYICPHCDREFRQSKNRFELNTPDGFKPYMKISRWGRWVKNSE